MSKTLTITHKDSGKKMKISWEGKDHPSENQIDELFQTRFHGVKNPFPQRNKDEVASQEMHNHNGKIDQIFGEVQGPFSPKIDSSTNEKEKAQDTPTEDYKENNSADDNPQNIHEEKETIEPDSMDEYFNTLDELRNDPSNQSHVVKLVSHAKKYGIHPDVAKCDLDHCGVESGFSDLASKFAE